MFIKKYYLAREEEFRILEECLADAGRKEGRIVLISAEAGGGKTSLVKEFLKTKLDQCLISEVICDPQKKEKGALNEFIEAVNQITTYHSYESSGFLKKSYNATKNSSSALASLIPIIGTTISAGITVFNNFHEEFKDQNEKRPADNSTHSMSDVINQIKSIAVENKPVIIFFDDLHLASDSSLQLLYLLCRERENNSLNLLFIGTYRSGEVDRNSNHTLHRIIKSIKDFEKRYLNNNDTTSQSKSEKIPVLKEVHLKSFDINDTRNLLNKIFLNHDFPEDFIEKIQNITDGNPMFIDFFIRDLADQKVIMLNTANQYELHQNTLIGKPKNLIDCIGKRLSNLNADFFEIMKYASVLGTRFELQMLEKMSSKTIIILKTMLDDLNKKFGIIVPGETLNLESSILRYYSFTHILIRKYAYESISDDLRGVYHQQAAEVIKYFCEDDFKSDPELYEEYKNHIRAAKGLIDGFSLKLTDCKIMPVTAELMANYSSIVRDELNKAFSFLIENTLIDGIKCIDKAENIILEFGDKLDNYIALTYDLHLYKAWLYHESGLLYLSYREAKLLEGYANLLANNISISKAYLTSYIFCAELNQVKESKIWMEKYLKFISKMEISKNNLYFFKALGAFFNNFGYYHLVNELYIRGLHEAERLNNSESISTYCNSIGVSYFNSNNFTEAISCFRRAIKYCQSGIDNNVLLVYLNNLSFSLIRIKNYDEALSINFKGLRVVLKIGDKSKIAQTYETIGDLYSIISKWRQSEKAHTKALECYKEIGNQSKVKHIQELLVKVSKMKQS